MMMLINQHTTPCHAPTDTPLRSHARQRENKGGARGRQPASQSEQPVAGAAAGGPARVAAAAGMCGPGYVRHICAGRDARDLARQHVPEAHVTHAELTPPDSPPFVRRRHWAGGPCRHPGAIAPAIRAGRGGGRDGAAAAAAGPATGRPERHPGQQQNTASALVTRWQRVVPVVVLLAVGPGPGPDGREQQGPAEEGQEAQALRLGGGGGVADEPGKAACGPSGAFYLPLCP